VLLKMEVREEREDGTRSKREHAELHYVSIGNDAAVYRVGNCDDGFNQFSRDVGIFLQDTADFLQQRNQFCPIKQMAKKSLDYLLCFQPSE